jgi:hypothetical protein
MAGTESDVRRAAEDARSALAGLGDVQLLPITLRRLEAAADARFGDPGSALTALGEAEAMARAYPATYEIGAVLDLMIRIAGTDEDPGRIAERHAIERQLGVVAWPPLLNGPGRDAPDPSTTGPVPVLRRAGRP